MKYRTLKPLRGGGEDKTKENKRYQQKLKVYEIENEETFKTQTNKLFKGQDR